MDVEDKSNGNLNRRMMARFRRLLNSLKLKELYLNGWRYTWTNERKNATLEKLDRVFVTTSWEELFPSCFLSALSTTISDHCPLLLDLEANLHFGKRFRFESFWPKAPGFMDTVLVAWESIPSLGNPFFTLQAKLRATTKALMKWSSRWIGSIKTQILVAFEIIFRLDVAMEARALSVEEIVLRRNLKRKLLGLCWLERTIARQRSRLLRLKEGDASTRFFHQHASYRRRRNTICQLHVDGGIITGQDSLAKAVDSFYTNLIGTTNDRAFSLDLATLGMPTAELSHLDAPITEEEIWEVVKNLPPDKAPGPDGFTGRFYRSCWAIVKPDFMRAVHCFSSGDLRGLGAINKVLVSLLPKKDGASELRDFRPVSLEHGAIKIFSKALANRMAPELASLVGSHQSAFVRGRALHDNFMLVQGTARKLHALREPACLLNLIYLKPSTHWIEHSYSKFLDSWASAADGLHGYVGFSPRLPPRC